jgi:hypothetical protein
MDVDVYELYPMALSKIARGLDTDMEDVTFLVESNLIDLAELAILNRPWNWCAIA